MRFVRVPLDLARRQAVELFESVGMAEELASIVVDVQIEADARGMHSHGLRAVPTYLERMRRGIINARPSMRVEQSARAAVRVHGDDGPGQAVAHRAMSECIGLARESGFGIAVARRSNHLGAVGYYANMALAHDLIGFASTNGNVMLPPPGALTPVVGNNPFAWAFPAGVEAPLCFDVATSVVAGGKIDLAAAEGDSIPSAWGVDASGQPTTNPRIAASSSLAVPLGAPGAPYKGFGLALVLEALSGVLAGAKFGRQHAAEVETGTMPWDEGHFFLAFDPAMVMPIDEFKARMDSMIQDIHAVAVDGSPARVPGEAAATRRARVSREGLRLPVSVCDALDAAAVSCGTPTRLASVTVPE